MSNYKTNRRAFISKIALEIAQFYDKWHNDSDMTETYIEQFIDNIIHLVKRDAQNTLYELQEQCEEDD